MCRNDIIVSPAQDAFELGELFENTLSPEECFKLKAALVNVNIDDLLETLLEFMLVKASSEEIRADFE